ncbi:4-hydroxyphenylacetate decarboxylase large subunit [Clostridioides difficile]|nr:4-hydroxyphenylacetate decarboxylase large subunit [Clostridioides difficile]
MSDCPFMPRFRLFFFFQAEDGIRDFCLSRGLGDVYKRQVSAYAGTDKNGVYALFESATIWDLSLIHI